MYSTATWTVATDQAVLTVRDHGSPDTPGPCFVLVHGFPDDHHVFDQLLENMAGHRVLTYGTRGSADAELAPGARVDLETLAEDLRQVIASIPGSPEVVLVGHDWGAVQCWAALADPLLAQQVRHHVSIAGPHLDHLRRQARRAALRPGRWRPTARQVARSWYAVALVLRPLQRWTIAGYLRQARRDLRGRRADPMNLRRGARLYARNVLPRMVAGPAPRCAVPTTVVHPSNDVFLGPVVLDELADWVDDLTVAIVPGGHWWPLDDPEACATLLVDAGDRAASR